MLGLVEEGIDSEGLFILAVIVGDREPWSRFSYEQIQWVFCGYNRKGFAEYRPDDNPFSRN